MVLMRGVWEIIESRYEGLVLTNYVSMDVLVTISLCIELRRQDLVLLKPVVFHYYHSYVSLDSVSLYLGPLHLLYTCLDLFC